jgi:hypothetical protein
VRFPDIEIYLQQPDLEALFSWLDQRLSIKDRSTSGNTHRLTVGDPPMNCTVVEHAHKNFTSVWLNSASSPWQDDQAFAQEAWTALATEVRCNSVEPDKWICINQSGQSVIDW